MFKILITIVFLATFITNIFAVEKRCGKGIGDDFVLFDFTKLPDLNGWSEQSDVVRDVGKSKAVMVLQKTQQFQQAVFFSLLNPQPDGSAFAGFRTNTKFDLSKYKYIQLYCRGQGENYRYNVILRHKNENNEPFPVYQMEFQAPKRTFEVVSLPLSKFMPYFQGRKQPKSPPLDKSQITNFGFQIVGGIYLPIKQSGTSSLEVDWVKATAREN